MTAELDRPIWTALQTRQIHFGKGDEFARRYDPDVSPFASARDDSAQSLNALHGLVRDGNDSLFLLQADPIVLPGTLQATKSALGVQMVQTRDGARRSAQATIDRLTVSDIPDMMALTELTKPGPFLKRTFEIGPFWGIRDGDRLAAMAGTRLDVPGYTEISGVCTHPEFQGRGLAALLSTFVADQIAARGDCPFLHAYADNDAAIRLYDRLGFRIRCEVHVAVAGLANP